MIMQDLLTAIALLLVIEGILPFLSPRALRKTLFTIVQNNDRTLRLTGASSMVAGLLLLYLVR
ncbi:DUF2065 family protein [Spiribacter sp. 2438]|nr:DUF2065 family protein [Spiribacter sp. 2438]